MNARIPDSGLFCEKGGIADSGEIRQPTGALHKMEISGPTSQCLPLCRCRFLDLQFFSRDVQISLEFCD